MKLWEVVVSDKVEPELRKKIKRILKPTRSVGRPQKCLFCGVDTTWTINDKPVCPKCAVEYGFLDKGWLPDPCEVCGRQGEWWTEGDPGHFLCYRHRDEWFHWKTPELEFLDLEKQPDKWNKAWEEGWSRFVAFMKEKEAEEIKQ